MKNIRKFSLMVVFLGILTIPIFTSAATVEELQSIINQLLAKLQILQQQLNTIKNTTNTTSTSTSWCHNFNINLRINNKGPEVSALQTALEKEGFTINQDEKDNLFFGKSTAAAVVSFQEKYKDEILTPFGLTKGTGYVGPSTRNKLNSLYGCGKSSTLYCAQVITPAQNPLTGECREFSTPCEVPANWNKVASCNTTSNPSTPSSISTSTPNSTPSTSSSTSSVSFIKVISPNGGEKWLSNTKQSIQVQTNVVNKRICLYLVRFSTYLQSIGCVSNSNNSILTYEWFVPSNLTTGYGYKISAITTDDNGKTLSDQSDYSFSIISSSTSSNTTITTTTNISNINTTSTTSSAVLLENATPVEIYSIQTSEMYPTNKYDYIDVFYDNGNIYVASVSFLDVSFFKSSDGGKTWVEKGKIVTSKLSSKEVGSINGWLKIKKTNNIFYVIVSKMGLDESGVFSSSDDGVTWQKVNLPEDAYVTRSNISPRRSADFLALDNRHFIVAYFVGRGRFLSDGGYRYTRDLLIARSDDAGYSWNKQVIDNSDYNNGSPHLEILPNGNIGLVYYKGLNEAINSDRKLIYRESSDKGLSWSTAKTIASSYIGHFNGFVDGFSTSTVSVVEDSSFSLISRGSNKIVPYSVVEYWVAQYIAAFPMITKSSGSLWNNQIIKTVDNLFPAAREEDYFQFAASPNGKYMGFLGRLHLVKSGQVGGDNELWRVVGGDRIGNVILIYSDDYGNTWKHKEIVSNNSIVQGEFAIGGPEHSFPEFSITDNGEVLVAYPYAKLPSLSLPRTNDGVYSVKFLRGKIE